MSGSRSRGPGAPSAAVLWLVVGVWACTDASAGDRDAGHGREDAGASDAGERDAGMDAGSMDAGSMDASSGDAGTHDSGRPDSGMRDAGELDAGARDAEVADAADSATEPDAATIAPPLRMHGLTARVENTSCFLNGSPPLEIVPVANAPVFAQLTASNAACAGSRPAATAATRSRCSI